MLVAKVYKFTEKLLMLNKEKLRVVRTFTVYCVINTLYKNMFLCRT